MPELLQPDPLLAQALARILDHMDRLTRLEQRMVRIEIKHGHLLAEKPVWRIVSWREAATLAGRHPWEGLLDRLAAIEARLDEVESQLPD